jgi:putative ABC transport system permease protein
MSSTVYGIDENYLAIRNVDLLDGSNISTDNLNNMERVAILGQDIVTELFSGKNPI